MHVLLGKPWSRRSALTAVRGITGAEAERVSDVEQPSSDAEQSEGEDGAKDVPADKDQAVVSEAVSDMDYLKSRMKKWKDEDEDMPDAGVVAGHNQVLKHATPFFNASVLDPAAASTNAWKGLDLNF